MYDIIKKCHTSFLVGEATHELLEKQAVGDDGGIGDCAGEPADHDGEHGLAERPGQHPGQRPQAGAELFLQYYGRHRDVLCRTRHFGRAQGAERHAAKAGSGL